MRRRAFAGLLVVVLVVLVVWLVGGGGGAVVACEHISAPASQPGGESRLVLEVSNLGDAAVDGLTNPVTIVDRLPAGVTATHVYGEGGGSFAIGINGVKEVMHCAIASQTS